jgi:hypothetical protein
MLVVAATGHHWWLDGIVAIGLLWIALQLDTLGRRAVAARRADAGAPDSRRTESPESEVVESRAS